MLHIVLDLWFLFFGFVILFIEATNSTEVDRSCYRHCTRQMTRGQYRRLLFNYSKVGRTAGASMGRIFAFPAPWKAAEAPALMSMPLPRLLSLLTKKKAALSTD